LPVKVGCMPIGVGCIGKVDCAGDGVADLVAPAEVVIGGDVACLPLHKNQLVTGYVAYCAIHGF
jgi:hypothetical protein